MSFLDTNNFEDFLYKKYQKSSSFQKLFVTLEDFSAFLCIKAVWGIEENLGYELATVLNSTFCDKLHQRTPDVEPATIYDSSSGAKVIISFESSKPIVTFLLAFSHIID